MEHKTKTAVAPQVLAEVYDTNGVRKMCVRFPTTRGDTCKTLVDMKVFRAPRDFQSFLDSYGCDFAAVADALKCHEAGVAEAFQNLPALKVQSLVANMGWQGHTPCFATPTGLKGADRQGHYLDWGALGLKPITEQGTFEAWKHAVTSAAACSPPLMLALGLTFAAPLLRFINSNTNRMVILTGTSSIGKTTLLQVTQSVFGNPAPEMLLTHDITMGGMGEQLAKHMDMLTPMDDLSTLANKKGEIQDEALARIYRISSPSGRKRHLSAGIKEEISRTIVLTTYEEVIGTERIGQRVRLVNVPVDMGKGYGVFGSLPEGIESSIVLRNQLLEAVLHNFAHAGPKFVGYVGRLLKKDGEETFKAALVDRINLAAEVLQLESTGPDARASEPFAWALVALELAVEAEVLGGFEPETIRKAIRKMYRRYAKLIQSEAENHQHVLKLLYKDIVAEAVNPREHPSDSRMEPFAWVKKGTYFIRGEKLEERMKAMGLIQHKPWIFGQMEKVCQRGKDGKATKTCDLVAGRRYRFYAIAAEDVKSVCS